MLRSKSRKVPRSRRSRIWSARTKVPRSQCDVLGRLRQSTRHTTRVTPLSLPFPRFPTHPNDQYFRKLWARNQKSLSVNLALGDWNSQPTEREAGQTAGPHVGGQARAVLSRIALGLNQGQSYSCRSRAIRSRAIVQLQIKGNRTVSDQGQSYSCFARSRSCSLVRSKSLADSDNRRPTPHVPRR